MGNFFGTDGIRGIFGQTLTPKLAENVGNALCQVKAKPKILIGSDTRLSSDILKCSLAVGVMLGGGDSHGGAMPGGTAVWTESMSQIGSEIMGIIRQELIAAGIPIH